nr:TadE family type IV pilus minor pilin [Actinomadura atramentaria]
MVTAEVALALPSLVLVTAVALWGVAAASARLACADAARAGARAAARGEPLAAVRSFVARAAPRGAVVTVRRDAAETSVDVSARIAPPGASGLPALTVTGRATSATEPGVLPDAESTTPDPAKGDH